MIDPTAPATIISLDRLRGNEMLGMIRDVIINILRRLEQIYQHIARVLNMEEEAAFTALTLANNWVDDGGVYQTARFRKAWGLVELQGYVKDGTATTVTTLAAGFRPTASHLFSVAGAAGGATVQVNADGTVVANTSGAGVKVSLSGIRFRAEA